MKTTKKLLSFKFIFLMLHLLISFTAYQFMVGGRHSGSKHTGDDRCSHSERPVKSEEAVSSGLTKQNQRTPHHDVRVHRDRAAADFLGHHHRVPPVEPPEFSLFYSDGILHAMGTVLTTWYVFEVWDYSYLWYIFVFFGYLRVIQHRSIPRRVFDDRPCVDILQEL